MKYIKIKVKTILILSIAIIMLGSLAYSLRDDGLYGIGVINEKLGNVDRANGYYKKTVDKFPHRDGGVKAANRRVESLLKYNDINFFNDKVIIEPRGVSKIGSTKKGLILGDKNLNKINEEHENIKSSYKKDSLLARYEVGVALMNWLGGESDKAIEILENLDYTGGNLEEIRRLHLAVMYINSGEVKKGKEFIKKDLKKNDKYKYVREDIIQYGNFMEGNFDNFGYNKKDNHMYRLKIEDPYMTPIKDASEVLKNVSDFIDRSEEYKGYKNKVTGNITYKGKPVSNVMIYALNNKDKSKAFSYEHIKAIGVSDSNGNFIVNNIPDGDYILGIIINWNRVKNRKFKFNGNPVIRVNNKEVKYDIEITDIIKITDVKNLGNNKFKVSWEDNRDDIVYYSVSLGKEGVHNYVETHTKLKSVTVDLDKLLKEDKVSKFGSYTSHLDLNPYYVLPPLYCSGEYKIEIMGYTKEKARMTDSFGTLNKENSPTVYIEGNELTEADKSVMNRDYEKGIELYKASLKENPKDMHAATMLATLYTEGWKRIRRSSGYYLGGGRDYKKARKYLRILRDNDKLTKHLTDKLADIELSFGNYDEAITLYKKLEDYRSYYYLYIGDTYAYKYDYNAALKYYKKYYNESKGAIERLAMLYILKNDTENLKKISKEKNSRIYDVGYGNTIDEYIKMDKSKYKNFFNLINHNYPKEAKEYIENNNDSLAKLYKGIFILNSNNDGVDREKEYKKIYEGIDNKTIRNIMIRLGKYRISSNFGDD
ncbi:tetratricopeptide repeat protein [Dethiothermospora halolimnae]|uniref:tetratricopeptide repeat protein n=1 Tax=Dethiothermospora halolimnae TaxID=3114390 RepID=UPI003CCBE53C